MSDRTIRVRLQAEVASYMAGLKQAAGATADFGRQLAGQGDAASRNVEQVGRAALGMGAALGAGFLAASRSAMNFEKQISELGAVSGTTGDELSTLRDAALEAGAATAFSASEAAEAQTELAKAGISTADILGGALTGSLDLAAAGGLELAEAATLAANAMTIFDLSGRDVSRIADTLAAGANKSAADVSDLGMALQQSGLVADQYGLSLEETVGTLSAFAQAGLRGSDAGTSFKTMLQRLTPQSTEAAEAMADLGIDMFDATGDFVGIEAAAQELQDGLAGLTEEQRNTALATIFGSDAVRAATILYEEGAAGIGEWVEMVDAQGFAADMAAQRMDNLAGDLETLKGALETALIEGGSQASGALRFLTQTATDAVNAFNEAPPALQGFVVGVGGITSAGLLAVGAVGTLVPKIQEARDALQGLGPAGVRANAALGRIGRLAAAAGGIAAVTGAIIAMEPVIRDFFVEDAPSLDKMALALVEFGQSAATAGVLAESFGSDLSGLTDDIDLINNRRDGFHIDLASDFDEAVGRIDAVDKSLASLVDGGHREAAEQIFADLLAGMDAVDAQRFADEMGDYSDALAASDTQQVLTGDSAQDLAADLGDAEEAAQDAKDAVDAYKDALRASTDPLFALNQANRNHAANQRGITTAHAELADAQARLNELRADPEATARDIERAEQDIVDAFVNVEDAQLAVYDSAFEVEQAQVDLAEQMAHGSDVVGDAAAALQRLADQGLITQEQVEAMLGPFGTLVGHVSTLQAAEDINLIFNSNVSEFTEDFERILAIYSTLQNPLPATGLPPNPFGNLVGTNGANGFGGSWSNPFGNAGGGYAGTNTWGPTDTINTNVSPGEFILSAQGASAFSPAELYGMNQGLRPAPDMAWMDMAAAMGGGGFSLNIEKVYGADTAGQIARGARRVWLVNQ